MLLTLKARKMFLRGSAAPLKEFNRVIHTACPISIGTFPYIVMEASYITLLRSILTANW